MKYLSIILFILLLTFANAAIDDYLVPSNIPLDEILTIDGQISPVADGVQCSIRVYNDQNILVKRLTDEFTTSNGVFSSSYLKVTEPIFKRNQDYNVFTDCAGDGASSIFTVGQRESFDRFVQQEFLFATSQENTDVYFIMGFIVLAIIFVFELFIIAKKVGSH